MAVSKKPVQKPEKVLVGKKQALTVKEEKKKPAKAAFEEEKDLFDEKLGEDRFEKKGLAAEKEEEAEEKEEAEDEKESEEWEDESDKVDDREKWQQPLPGRFEEEDNDL